jgi:chorismate dehydratase
MNPPDKRPEPGLLPESAEHLGRRLKRERQLHARKLQDDLDEIPLAPMRIGSVPYLNAVPLTRGIEDQIVFSPPSRLAELLRLEKLDAALVSVTEVLFNDRYDILDRIAVASLGEVKSVFLAHRKPLEEVTEVSCDPASLTSVSLLKVLLAERGLQPDLVPLPDYHDAQFKDAVLLIGDPALNFVRAPHEHQIWDLGTAWFELTGLPFVYAVWALRRGIDTVDLRRVLHDAKALGMETLDTIIRDRSEYEYEFRKDYLGWHIHYHLGTDEKRGMAKFVDLLRQHGAEKVYDPNFLS